ncbi:ABC transporter permease [Embleya sp. NPDC005575]|uniref:ABC transporter permease n=1 Tax=Embleya sp. NPDC005575 TaxID=3156892 RepID=UPI0033A4EF51
MLTLALMTLRTRWTAFASAFVALALGVGLLATMGLVVAATADDDGRTPLRFADAPMVVRVAPDLRVTSPLSGTNTQELDLVPPLRADLVAGLAAVAPVVADRNFATRLHAPLTGPADRVGHPWSTARYGRYALTAGQEPAGADRVVVGGGDPALTGTVVTVSTPSGPRTYTVSGVTAPVGFEHALFFTDAEAERLSPAVDALIVSGPTAPVRAVLAAEHPGATRVELLTGIARASADPGTLRDHSKMIGTQTLLGVAGGVAAFVAILVVASTFAYAVAQRRRELALLRALGGTPRQLRRLLLAEAAALGLAASVAGSALGVLGGPLLADWLASNDFAPAWFAVRFSPLSIVALLVALLIGWAVALLAVVAASVRAGRIRPIEALHEATVERRSGSRIRSSAGVLVLGCGIAALAGVAGLLPQLAFDLGNIMSFTLLITGGVVLLAPLLARVLAAVLTRPFTLGRGAGAMLVRANTVTAGTRTAATATPVLASVALAACLLGATGSVDAAHTRELRAQASAADFVVVPEGAAGLDRELVDRVRAVPGTDAVALTPTTVYTIPTPRTTALLEGDVVRPYAAQAIDTAGSTALHLSVEAGSMADLRDDTIVVDRGWNRRVGDRIALWRADGSPLSLRVAAVLTEGTGNGGVFLTPTTAGTTRPARMYVALRPGTDRGTAAAALTEAIRGQGAREVTSKDWTTAVQRDIARQNRLGIGLLLTIALVYSGIAIANTLLMATAVRTRELALLRLAGVTRRQVLRLLATEALLITAIGVVLATAATSLVLTGLHAAWGRLVQDAPLILPWTTPAGITAACALIALLSTVLPAQALLRHRPIELAATRE